MDTFPMLSADKCVFLVASYGFVIFYRLLGRYESVIVLLSTLYIIADHSILVHLTGWRDSTYYKLSEHPIVFLASISSFIYIIFTSTMSIFAMTLWALSLIVTANLRLAIDDEWPDDTIHHHHVMNMSKGIFALYCISRIVFILCTFYYYESLL